MRTIFLLMALLAAVVLAVQNAAVVTVELFVWRIEASLAVVIAACFAIGVAAGVLLVMPKLYRARADRRRLRAQLQDLGAEEHAGPTAVPSSPSSIATARPVPGSY